MTPDPVAPVIAVDGPVGSGKGVICHRLAKALGFHLLDSGALYRLIGLAARKHGVPLDDEDALADLAHELDIEFRPTSDPEEPLSVHLEGEDVTRAIRTDQAGTDASVVAPLSRVREAIKALQRSFKKPPGLVADGRDMGTVVFTDAEAKIYLTASAEARAERRYKQLIDKGISVSLHDLFLSIQARDDRDMNREVAPLVPAPDAIIIDSTDLTIDQVFEQVLTIVGEKIG
ncbi:MAG: (d)CMP kinase [Pseudomonadales bacterium]|nr:(d)CMP kinase [Pseudomonadales bacterium]